jgi:spore germination protein YaaH
MSPNWKYITALSFCLALGADFSGPLLAAGADKTTNYRVYQDNLLLKEFPDAVSARQYAQGFADSHVEEIGTRRWIWDNFPRYRVYQNGKTLPQWGFATLSEAVAEAGKWAHASVRDLQAGGWVWNNYPAYRLYQGEITLDGWEFPTLAAARAEARKWAGAHIIELNTNEWVWDNLTDQEKARLRSQAPVYRVYQGQYTRDDWVFAFLGDAVREALRWANSVVVNTETGQEVYSNLKTYKVYQNGTFLEAFAGLDEAVAYARRWAHSSIVRDGRAIWTNIPYYQIYQRDALIGESDTLPGALQLARQYSGSIIRTLDGETIWDNLQDLQVWGWNGMSAFQAIRTQAGAASGLDSDSPSWFTLADAQGNLKDASDPLAAEWLNAQGLQVRPLVSNQFDSSLTSRFLSDPDAQGRFIRDLVDRCSALGVNGINLDFENVAGADRDRFTAFLQRLADAAHQKRLDVSVDLVRGDTAWNAKTAYDHEKIGQIVDHVVIMAYDQYTQSGTSPGPVSGLPWTEEGIRQFLSYGIPREKLILGIPLYVRVWKLDDSGKPAGNRTVYIKDLPALLKEKSARLTWDPQFGQNRAEYEEDGFRYVVWVEDTQTLRARIDLARKYSLAGIAAWRLGFDSPEIWQIIRESE